MNKVKLFEGFSGYGSQKLAFKRLGIEVESVGISEIDPDAIIAYAALHCDESQYIDEGLSLDEKKEVLIACNVGYDFKKEKSSIPRMKKTKLEQLFKAHVLSRNKGDISLLKTDELPDMDFFTYSFPCTDISVAGKQEGLSKGSGTRSSLLWECEKVITGKRPEYLMMENVKNLVGKNHKEDFDIWLGILDGLGYNNYWKVINAKDCGVPQNRERVFCVSVRKDVDNGRFVFNESFDNGVRLKDVLEDEVDEKYYIADGKVEKLISKLKEKGNKFGKMKNPFDIVDEYLKENTIEEPLALDEQNKKIRSCGTLGTLTTDGSSPKKNNRVVVPCLTPDRTDAGQDRHGVLLNESIRLGGLFDKENSKHQAGSVWDKEGLSPTLDTMQGGYRQPSTILDDYRIRKLTPKECFRLMGLTDEEIRKIQDSEISNSQQYKMAGNSIVVDQMFFLKNLF